MNKNCNNIILYSIILTIFLLLIIYIIFYFKNKKTHIKYYKCKEKDNSILLKKIFQDNNIIRADENYDLYIPCGYNNVENELLNTNFNENIKYVFGIKGCDKIVSKNNLWKILELKYGRNLAKQLMPDTYILNDNNQLNLLVNQYKLNNNLVFICKKNIQRKEGLKIINNLESLYTAKRENYKIAQLFLKNTLKINNRKLNLRIYYIVKCYKNNIYFYISKNGKCLYTNKDSNNNFFDKESHITSYKMDNNIYNINPYDFKALKTYFSKKLNKNWNLIWNNIINIFKDLSKACYKELKQPDNLKNKICFQLFGCDVIFDNNLKPYLLEINKGPDMIPKIKQDFKLKEKIYFDTMNILKIFNKNNNSFKLIYKNNV